MWTLIAIILVGRALGQTTVLRGVDGMGGGRRPATNATYWTATFTASVLGTATADMPADRPGFGVGHAGLLMTVAAGASVAVLSGLEEASSRSTR